MTDAQARYSATLRKWASYARALAGGVPVDVDAAELARAVDFTCGDFAREDFAEYQMFRAALVNRPELLAEFDGLRKRTRAAWDAAQTFGVDAARALRLADALDVEAEYVGRVGLSEAGGGALEAVADALIKQGVTLDRIDANTRPQRSPRGEYNVTQEEAARRLGRTVRTVKNWEAGKNTPEGYSRETRRTLETFAAWASSWAAKQKSKLNTKKAMRYADEHGYTFGARRR